MLVTLVAASLATATPAGADNFDRWYANGTWHDFFYYNLTELMDNASNWARTNAMNPTALETTKVASHDLADVSVMDEDYDVTWIGLASCENPDTSLNTCNHWHVKFDTSRTNAPERDAAFRHEAACHEFGHTVGLKHHFGTQHSCMRDAPAGYREYNQHDKDHIQSRY